MKKIFSVIFAIIIAFSIPISAKAYEVTGFTLTDKPTLLASIDTGEILYSNQIDKKVYPASITKIMTSIVILENEKFNPEGRITMTKEVLNMILGTGSVVSNLKAGEEISQLDLIYLILMSSAGDCAYLAANFYEGGLENFVKKMNEYAKKLGLANTHYANPIGLHDEQNYTTVRDIWKLTLYALKNETFKTVCQSARYSLPATNMSPSRTISTTNFLQDNTTNYYYQYAKGVKTGFTDESGRCVVSTASYNGYNYICIVMGRPNGATRLEFVESANLYRWAFNNFSYKQVAKVENPVCEIPVELSLQTDFIPLYISKSIISILPNDADESTIVIEPHLKFEKVDAPIKKGDVLGQADIIYAEQVIGRVDLVSAQDVEASLLLIAVRAIKEFINSFYMKILLAVAAVFAVIFIIMCIRLNIGRGKKRKVKYLAYNERKDNFYDR